MSNTSNYELVATLHGNRLRTTKEVTDFMVGHYDRAINHAYRDYDRCRAGYLASVAAERKAELLLMCGYWHDVADAYRDAAWHALGGNIKRDGKPVPYSPILVDRGIFFWTLGQKMSPSTE